MFGVDRPVVFLGPSCSVAHAKLKLDADFRPPATAGDIDTLVRTKITRVIVLIDGVLVDGYPPSPRELVRALDAGCLVFGAASIGALRAVELWRQGMRGSGWIYRMYKAGRIDRDDELVSLMHPEHFFPLTVPLIRLRFALRELRRDGRIEPRHARILFNRLKNVHYEERSAQRVRDQFSKLGLETRIANSILTEERFDIKKLDCIGCLEQVSALCEAQRGNL